MSDINIVLDSYIKMGKLLIGSKESFKAAKTGKASAFVFSSDCEKDIVDKIKYFTKISKIPVYIFPGSRIDLGLKCKKNFKISVLTLR